MARKSSVEKANQKIGGFAVAKKKVILQYASRDYSYDDMMELVRQDIVAQGIDENTVEFIEIYIKPEESAVYYVINHEINGKVVL